MVGDLHRDHLGVTAEVANSSFLLIAHDWKELETWSHCVFLVHIALTDMQFNLHGSSRGLELKSNVDLTFKVIMHMFRRASTRMPPELRR